MKSTTAVQTLRKFALSKELSLGDLSRLLDEELKERRIKLNQKKRDRGDEPKKAHRSNSAYQLALRHVSLLESEYLIRLKEEKKSKHGNPSKIYELTLLGLIGLLSKDEETFQKLDTVVRAREGLLPLVFGKWGFFESQGLKQTVIDNLKFASIMLINDELWLESYKRFEVDIAKINPKNEGRTYLERSVEFRAICPDFFRIIEDAQEKLKKANNPANDFVNYVFGLTMARTNPPSSEATTRLLNLLREDEEIKEYISAQMDRMVREYETLLSRSREWCDWLTKN